MDQTTQGAEQTLVSGEAEGLLFARDLSSREALGWEGVEAGGRPVWAHMDRTAGRAQAWLRLRSGVPPLVAEALLVEDTRPRVDAIDGGLLIILRGANLNEGAEPEDMVALRMWLTRERLLTLERFPIFAARDGAARVAGAERGTTPQETAVFLAERLVERLDPLLDRMDERLYELEDRAIDPSKEVERGELADLMREVIYFRRYLAPQREALRALSRDETGMFAKDERRRLHESADRLARMVEDLEAAHQRALLAQNEQAAQLNEKVGRRLYLFTIFTIVFLPLTFVTGMLGINVGGIPYADSEHGFEIVSGLLLALAVATLIVLRRWRWL